jgi:hypothetical protein
MKCGTVQGRFLSPCMYINRPNITAHAHTSVSLHEFAFEADFCSSRAHSCMVHDIYTAVLGFFFLNFNRFLDVAHFSQYIPSKEIMHTIKPHPVQPEVCVHACTMTLLFVQIICQ